MINTRRSGHGLRSNLHADNGDLLLSLWAVATVDEVEDAVNRENLYRMQQVDRAEHELARDFAAQQWAEYIKIRERA
jgi:hypothetical protein